jgi:hypothetical protein
MGPLGEGEPVVDLAEPVLGRVAALGGVQVPRKVRRLCLDGVIASVQSGQLHDEVFEGRRLYGCRSKGGDEKCCSDAKHGSPTASSARRCCERSSVHHHDGLYRRDPAEMQHVNGSHGCWIFFGVMADAAPGRSNVQRPTDLPFVLSMRRPDSSISPSSNCTIGSKM